MDVGSGRWRRRLGVECEERKSVRSERIERDVRERTKATEVEAETSSYVLYLLHTAAVRMDFV
jgi:hypothetical protein